MKGLLLKDIYCLKKSLKIYGIMFLFYGYWCYSIKDISMAAMFTFLSIMLSISSMSYDEFYKWDIFALTTPVKRKELVLSKYLLGYFFIIVGTWITLTIAFFVTPQRLEMTWMEIMMIIGTYASIGLFYQSLVFPIIFKFGPEKGRIAMFILFAIPSLFIIFFAKSSMTMPLPGKEFLQNGIVFGILFLFIIEVSSIVLSIKIMEKKEF